MCQGSQFDSRYSWTRELANNFYVLRGYTDAVLQFDTAESLWKLVLYSTNETYATNNATDYPFGARRWTVYGDPCFEVDRAEVTLNLNACNESEYNCANGQCISMRQRCDGVLDCKDFTGSVSSKFCSTKA